MMIFQLPFIDPSGFSLDTGAWYFKPEFIVMVIFAVLIIWIAIKFIEANT